MDKKEIIKILTKVGTLLELRDENFFKIRAYTAAARALESSDIEINLQTSLKELTEIKGIGSNIAGHIKELLNTGSFPLYRQLEESTPPGLLEMLKIPTLGAKKVKYLYENLGITNIGELEYACIENKLSALPGFGEKSQENILKGIETIKKYQERFLFADIIIPASTVLEKIKGYSFVKRASLGGSVRRKKEIVKDIDLVASTEQPEKVMDFFTGMEEAEDVIAKGETKSSIRLKSGINVDIRIVSDSQYPYALHHFTGSKEHNTAMRSMAKKMGIKMNEYGLFKGDTLINCRDEKDIFSVFSMDYIPPELRENFGEIEAAKNKTLPSLIEEKDIRGLLHIHTIYSDGKMTIPQAVREAKKMGLEYVGISEHGRSAWYAGGLKESGILSFLEEIDIINKSENNFTVFKGIESNILADGQLDYGNEILEKFDFVIAAVHSNFNMGIEENTNRIIKAIKNKYTTILAHPTGRLLLARDPYNVDMVKIINAAAENNTDLELNASPYRLDIDWMMCKYAKEKGVKIFINPDAHSLETLYDYKFGVNIARKGWLEKENVVNTMDLNQITDYFKKKKLNGK